MRLNLLLGFLGTIVASAVNASGPCETEKHYPLIETANKEPEVFYATIADRHLKSETLVHCKNALWEARFQTEEVFKGSPPSEAFAEFTELYNDPESESQCASTNTVKANIGAKYLVLRTPEFARMLTQCSGYFRLEHQFDGDLLYATKKSRL